MGNFRETFGNFLETVRVVIGQESVRVGMWSPLDMAMLLIRCHSLNQARRKIKQFGGMGEQ